MGSRGRGRKETGIGRGKKNADRFLSPPTQPDAKELRKGCMCCEFSCSLNMCDVYQGEGGMRVCI